MKKILAFGASNSKNSINKKLATWAAAQLKNVEVNIIDLNDFEMPLYSIDKEKENGIPQQAQDFKAAIQEADGILISFAEHNASYTVAFKNLMDWASRVEKSLWHNRPLCFFATSPGARGGQSVLKTAADRAQWMDGRVISSFSLPSFYDNFGDEGIKDEQLREACLTVLQQFQEAL
jgi:chromate reductase